MKTIELIKEKCKQKKAETIKYLKEKIDFNSNIEQTVNNLKLITKESEKTVNELKIEINKIIINSKEDKEYLQKESDLILKEIFESIILEFL